MLFSEILSYKSIVFPQVAGNAGLTVMKKLYHNFPVNKRGFISTQPTVDKALPKATIYLNDKGKLNSALQQLNIQQLANNEFHLFIHGFEINRITQAFEVCGKINEIIASMDKLKNLNIYIAVDLGVLNGNVIKNHLQYDLAIKKMLPKLKAKCVAYLYRPWFYGIEEEFVNNVRVKYKTKPEQCWLCKKIGPNMYKELIGFHIVGNQFFKMKQEIYYHFTDEIE